MFRVDESEGLAMGPAGARCSLIIRNNSDSAEWHCRQGDDVRVEFSSVFSQVGEHPFDFVFKSIHKPDIEHRVLHDAATGHWSDIVTNTETSTVVGTASGVVRCPNTLISGYRDQERASGRLVHAHPPTREELDL